MFKVSGFEIFLVFLWPSLKSFDFLEGYSNQLRCQLMEGVANPRNKFIEDDLSK